MGSFVAYFTSLLGGAVCHERPSIATIIRHLIYVPVYLARVCTLDLIKKDHPDWVKEDGACPKCKAYYESLEGVVSVVGKYLKG